MDFTYCRPLAVNAEFDTVAKMFESSIGRNCCLQNIFRIEQSDLTNNFE
jgi:hypothetical protein